WGMRAAGIWKDEREANILDGAAHFYSTYETKDGKFVSLAAIEDKFYALMLEKLGLAGENWPKQMDKAHWPRLRARVAEVIKTKTRAEWDAILEGTDVCYAPVLSFEEASKHPHNVARGSFVEVEGVVQPGPAPKFSRTPGKVRRPPARAGEHTDEVLVDWGIPKAEIEDLKRAGAIGWKAPASAAE
ncbi:MAG: CoA transferase, partial [Alphaproteobacteria bacterium]|nr:CoA transferase [Alphaproteobacteria bacterium]